MLGQGAYMQLNNQYYSKGAIIYLGELRMARGNALVPGRFTRLSAAYQPLKPPVI